MNSQQRRHHEEAALPVECVRGLSDWMPFYVFCDGGGVQVRTDHFHKLGVTPEWETPAHVFDPLHEEFRFTLDVCANDQNAKCPVYLTRERDGLTCPWGLQVCWMNPPYGREIREWMKKAYESAQQGATVVCLVPARTDAGWWHDYAMKGEVRFVRGRIKFSGSKDNAPFPSAVVVFRAKEIR